MLTDRREQEEVIEIFEKINKETGWRIGFVYGELKDKWGWVEPVSPEQYAQTHDAARKVEQNKPHGQHEIQLQPGFDLSIQHTNLSTPPSVGSSVTPPNTAAPTKKRLPSGILNPLYAKADFNLPQHPYQDYYIAPNGNAQAGNMWWNG